MGQRLEATERVTMELLFLSVDEVIEIHSDQIARYGGSLGLRDESLLLSALAMPQAGCAGEHLHRDLFEMAAAYLYHLVMNHPFVDGNKRVGTVAARVFLILNRWDVLLPEDALYDLVIAVAEGHADKNAVATAFRAACVRLE